MRIADFGFAVKERKQDPNFIYGTPGYIAPEILRGDIFNNKSDIFSIGSILFNILANSFLFPVSPCPS